MRLIVRILLCILFLTLPVQCKKEKPENPLKNEITDINFLNALIERGIDTNGDGIINPAEAAAVDYLDLKSCNIKHLWHRIIY